MTPGWTHLNLDAVDDVAPANGFGDRWEAHAARQALCAEQTGVVYFRLHPGKRSPFSHRHTDAEEIYVILAGSGKVKLDDRIVDVCALDAIRVAPEVPRAFEAGMEGLEFIAFGAHHPGDGEPVNDDWVS
jgi:mannose-6-phosphate isomerase-like protein (cupin superfamily)